MAFVTAALTFKAEDRPSIAELLGHPWIKQFCKKPTAVANQIGHSSFKKLSSMTLRRVHSSVGDQAWTGVSRGPAGESGPRWPESSSFATPGDASARQ